MLCSLLCILAINSPIVAQDFQDTYLVGSLGANATIQKVVIQYATFLYGTYNGNLVIDNT